MKDLIYKFLYEGELVISPLEVIASMSVAFVLAMILYITYRVTFNGVIYSKKFNISLVMLTLITTMVMNIIGSSIALSLGMVGALSIVRFRTAIKDPRDTAYIFWAITIGLGMGTSNYYIAAIGTVCLSIVSIVISISFSSDDSFLVIIRVNSSNLIQVRSSLFQLYRGCKLRSEVIQGDVTEIVYQVKLKKHQDIHGYEEIKLIDGVKSINIVAQSGEVLG